jgi:hypothetical protein
VQYPSARHVEKTNACVRNVKTSSSSSLQSLGYNVLRGSQDPLLKSQDLGDSSFSNHHDGGLDVAGGKIGVDAAVNDELGEVSDSSGVNVCWDWI